MTSGRTTYGHGCEHYVYIQGAKCLPGCVFNSPLTLNLYNYDMFGAKVCKGLRLRYQGIDLVSMVSVYGECLDRQ